MKGTQSQDAAGPQDVTQHPVFDVWGDQAALAPNTTADFTSQDHKHQVNWWDGHTVSALPVGCRAHALDCPPLTLGFLMNTHYLSGLSIRVSVRNCSSEELTWQYFKDTMNQATDLVSPFVLTPEKLTVRLVAKLR